MAAGGRSPSRGSSYREYPSKDDEQGQAPRLQRPDPVVIPAREPSQGCGEQEGAGIALRQACKGADGEKHGPERPADSAGDPPPGHTRGCELTRGVLLAALIRELLGGSTRHIDSWVRGGRFGGRPAEEVTALQAGSLDVVEGVGRTRSVSRRRR